MFLKNLRKKVGDGRVWLYMDHLAVHKKANVLAMYDELQFDVVFDVKYFPDFQPIESIFSYVKAFYKK